MSTVRTRIAETIEAACIDGMPSADFLDTLAIEILKAIREPTERMGLASARVEVTAREWSKDPHSEREPHHMALSTEELQAIGASDRLHGNPARWQMPNWRAMIDVAIAEEPDKG